MKNEVWHYYPSLLRMIFLAGAVFAQDSSFATIGSTQQHEQPRSFNASMLIKKLWALPFDQFNQQFEQIVEQLLVPQIAGMRTVASRLTFAYHCNMVHLFLSHLFVDQKNNGLIYGQTISGEHNDTFVPLVAWWKSHRYTACEHFYALYFDCLAQLFIMAVHEAALQRGSMDYAGKVGRAERYIVELHALYSLLVGSDYEERYARQLNRYQGLLATVREPQHP